MGQIWLFQANPTRYQIDEALAAIDEIHWRVPQHTSQVSVGDIVLLWRSGQDAGIVGVGTVQTPPAAVSVPASELRFNLGDDDQSVVTRVRLAVRPAPFVPKDVLEALPEFDGHQILTAPMGTVFPMSDEQWQSLRGRLPEPPGRRAAPSTGAERDDLPPPFAWKDRYKSVHPLPGGGENYLATVTRVLERVAETQPESKDLSRWLMAEYDVGERRAALTVNFLQRVSLLHSGSARLSITEYAKRWLSEPDPLFLLALVHSRIRFIGEYLEHLSSEPRTPEDLLRYANDCYSSGWSTRAQIDRRRHLLGGLGAVQTGEGGGLELSDLGRRALAMLTLEPPRLRHDSAAVADPATPNTEPSVEVHASEVEELVGALEESSHNSADPNAFEIATRDAFAFLGFDAQWLGGSGKTDVLIVAQLGRDDTYRAIIDTKTTANVAVSDGQIDWVTLADHREHYDADFVVLVAPAFQGPRVRERAESQNVSLLDVPAVVSLVRQHAEAPLGLDSYRAIFERRGSVDAIVEEADEIRRLISLAADVLRLVTDLQDQEGALDANDLYWNLKAESDDQFDPPSREDLTSILEVLAAPPLAVLSRSGHGYRTLGSRETVLRRLRILTNLVAAQEAGSPD